MIVLQYITTLTTSGIVIKPILIQLAALFLTALPTQFAINFMNCSFICLL